jgi:hypothetical protein
MSLVTPTLQRRAWFALQQLDATEQQTIMDAVEALHKIPPLNWPAESVQLLDPEKSKFLVKAGSDWFAVVVRSPSGDLEIADVMNRDLVEWMSNQSRGNGKSS